MSNTITVIKKLYLAGPMSGIPEHNFPAFNAAAKKLRDKGYEVWNPAENDAVANTTGEGGVFTYEKAMSRDLPWVCWADATAVLPGWQQSRGANIEIGLTRALGHPVIDADTCEPIDCKRVELYSMATSTEFSVRTTEELLSFHERFCLEARNIMAAKNHDYAGHDGSTPFANFEVTERLGITSTEKGMLVRIVDKIQRLKTFADSGVLRVKGEGVRDACMDIANYVILFAARCDTGSKK